MPPRPASRPIAISQSTATRYLKAAKAAGYERARVVIYPDRIEVIAEGAETLATPLEAWRRTNGQG